MPRLVFLFGLVRTRPYVRLLIGLTLVLLAYGATVSLLRLSEPIGPRAFERLRLGMSRVEIEDAIGLAPGDYAANPRERDAGGRRRGLVNTKGLSHPDVPVSQVWRGDRYAITVILDSQGQAVSYGLVEIGPPVFHSALPDALAVVALGLLAIASVLLLVRLSQSGAR